MNRKVENIATFQAGYPFRSGVIEAFESDLYAVQIKDTDAIEGILWSSLTPTRLEGRNPPNWITAGDVIFISRGQRNLAFHVDEAPVQAVCSPHFFHMRVATATLLPEFLAWQINQAPAQAYFRRSREGSNQPSIRRDILAELPVAVPSLETQRKVVALDRLIKEETRVHMALLENNQTLMNALASGISKGKIQ